MDVGRWYSYFLYTKHKNLHSYMEGYWVSGPMYCITEIKDITSSIQASDSTGIIKKFIIIRQEKQMCLINPKALEQKSLIEQGPTSKLFWRSGYSRLVHYMVIVLCPEAHVLSDMCAG